MASTSKVEDKSDDNTAEELSSLTSDSEADVENEKQNDDDIKTKDDPVDSKPEKKSKKLKSRRRRKVKRRETSSLDRTQSVDTFSEKSALSSDGKKLRKRKQQKVNKFFVDPNGAIERKLEQKYVELEELLSRQFVERKTNLTHLHIGQMEVLRQQYNLSCHGLTPTGVQPYTEGPRRRPHSAHHSTPAWDRESDEAYSAIRQIQQMSKFPQEKRKARSKSAKSRRETYSDTESHRQNVIDINLETASLSSARSPRSRKKRSSSNDHESRRSLHSRDSTSPSLSPNRGYIPTDNQLRDTDNKRIKDWLRKKNIELRKQRAVERAEKKEKRKESILKENEKIVARESGRSKVEEWMNRKRREAIELKKAEKVRHRQMEEEQKEKEAKKKMEFVQGKSWMRPASAPASRSKGKGLIASSTDDPSTSTDSQSSRPVPHPPSSKLMYKRSSAGRVRLRAKSSDKAKSADTDTKPPTEKSLDSSQLTYSEWLDKKRIQDAEKKKADAEAKSKAAAKSDSDLENLLPDLHKKRVNKVLKSKKRVDSGLKSEDEQTSPDAESPVEAFLTVSGAKAELTTRNSYPRPQSAKLPSPQPCKSPKRPKSAHPRVDAIMDEEEKDEGQENPFHLPFPAHLGLPTEVAKTQTKVFPERVAAERKSIEDKKATEQESKALVVQENSNEAKKEQTEDNILEESEDAVEEDILEEPEVKETEEESPRVGASFFKTDPKEEDEDEPAYPVDVPPPPAISEQDEIQASFLDNSQEKLEPDKDKNDQKPLDHENRNGNNNNSSPYTEITSEVVSSEEVNVTELPSEKIPTLDVNDHEDPKEEYEQDIFATDSEDEEEDEDDPEEQVMEDEQNISETFPINEDAQETNTLPDTSADGNQIPEPESSAVTTATETTMTAEQESVDQESPDNDKQKEETTATISAEEEASESQGEPSQQEAEVTDEVPEKVYEEIEEEIDESTMSQDEQYFLDKSKSKPEPDKLEFLEQVIDSLPEVDDDSKGETSSLEELAKPDNSQIGLQIDQTSNQRVILNQSSCTVSQMPPDTETYELEFQPANTDYTQEENETPSSDPMQQEFEEISEYYSSQECMEKKKESESEYVTIESSKQEDLGSAAQSPTLTSPPQPLTPTLGRHLSNEELLANIQAGKKLISIPDSGATSENDESGALEDETSVQEPITETSTEEAPPQETQEQIAQSRKFQDKQDPAESNSLDDLDECKLDAQIIDEQRQLKLAAVEQISQDYQSPSTSRQDGKDAVEPQTVQRLGEGLKDDDVIKEQRDLKQTTLAAIEKETRDTEEPILETEMNPEPTPAPTESTDPEKDIRIINDQETFKAGTLEELNDSSHKSPLIQPIEDGKTKADQMKPDTEPLHETGTNPKEEESELPSEYNGPQDGNENGPQDEENVKEDANESLIAEQIHMDRSAMGNDQIKENAEYSNDTVLEENNGNTDVATDVQTYTESDEEILKNLQNRLQKLRSYDADEFPVMHQRMHEPTPARAMLQEPENLYSDVETDRSYQSPESSPEPLQEPESKQLSDSFKRGLYQSMDGEREQASHDTKDLQVSMDVQNSQLEASQSNLTADEVSTEIPEELPTPEDPDSKSQSAPSNLYQNGFEDQNNVRSTSTIETDTTAVPSTPYGLFSDDESIASSDEVNNNKVKPDGQTELDNHDQIIESLSDLKSSIDQTEQTNGDVTLGENEVEKLNNLENEFSIVPDNRDEQGTTDLNDNIKPILSTRDDNSTNESPSRQKKVSFSSRPIVIQEGNNQSVVESDSDAVDEVLRTMI